MSVYADIVSWSVGLPLWQRDALRRLAAGPLAEPEVEAVARLCFQEINQIATQLVATPIDASHVPTTGPGTSAVALLEVSNTRSVNALVDGQALTFGPTGLTVVYGDNGAGKSGFARVLRHACQARGRDGAMLPNVFAPAQGAPSATVNYHVAGAPQQWTWNPAGNGPTSLARVAVFDSLAANELVETENAILWTPGGLDLLEHLARAVDAVRRRLEEAAATLGARLPLPQVEAGTAAHTFLSKLSAETSASALDAMALTLAEVDELSNLQAALAAPDPAATAALLRQRAGRFRSLAGRVRQIEAGFGAAGLAQLQELRAAFEAAAGAEVALANQTFGDSVVPGVGEAAWRTLWQAAEAYALAGATPDRHFPSTMGAPHCVLCQQPLAETSKERLGRFRSFVRADAAQRRAAASGGLGQALTQRRAIRAHETGDAGVLAEITEAEPQHGPTLGQWLRTAQSLHSAVAALDATSATWSLPPPVQEGWAVWLDGLAAAVEARVTAMVQSANPAGRAVQIARRRELLARHALMQGRGLIEAEVARLRKQAQLTRAVNACVTTGITRKAGELTKQYVSDRLVAQFGQEATALRLPQTVEYRPSKNEKGTSYQQMRLVAAPWAANVARPSRVLSEGERRAVALAAFLAEIGTRSDASAVVLDDPVSSLDHDRRRTVASRLAEVAAARQVIVFTHDLVFLHMVKAAAAERGVTVTDRELRRAGTSAGYCRNRAPAKAMTVKALVAELNAHAQACAALHRAGDADAYERDITQGYGLLREAWERAVEELLFNQSVMRFDHRVQTCREAGPGRRIGRSAGTSGAAPAR